MTHVMMRSQRTIVLAVSLAFFTEDAWTQERISPQSSSVGTGSSEANDANAANNPLESLRAVS